MFSHVSNMNKLEKLKACKELFEAEADSPPCYINTRSQEMHLSYDELYDSHLHFILSNAMCYNLNVKLEAVASFNRDRPDILVIIY